MKRATQWFNKNTQQAVMSKASVIPMMIRTGTTTQSTVEQKTRKSGESVFVVGQSVVGGKDMVGGTR